MLKPLPDFESEPDAQAFWAEADSADYVDWTQARPVVLPALRPTTRTISLRLPAHLIDSLKVLAHKRDVPYQSLLKLFLAERVDAELRSGREGTPERAA